MAAERLVAFHELREKLAGLEEGLRVAEGELKALEAKRSRLEQSEQEKGNSARGLRGNGTGGSGEAHVGGSGNGCTSFSDSRSVPARGPVEASLGASAVMARLDKHSARSEGTRRSARMAG